MHSRIRTDYTRDDSVENEGSRKQKKNGFNNIENHDRSAGAFVTAVCAIYCGLDKRSDSDGSRKAVSAYDVRTVESGWQTGS